MSRLAYVWERGKLAARGLASTLFRGARYMFRTLRDNDRRRPIDHISVVLPRDATARTLGDALNRVAWYFGTVSVKDGPETEITFYVPVDILDARPNVPAEQRKVVERVPPIRRRPRGDLWEAEHDLVLVWAWADLFHPRIVSDLGKVRLVDESFFSGQASTEFRVASQRVSAGVHSQNELESVFRSNFERLLDRGAAKPRSATIGTGPSVEEILDVDVSDTSVVVCNSIVKNERLLDHLRPLAVCFADPVFHFGPSEYAARFRDDLIRVVDKYDCFAVTHARDAQLLLQHHPDLEDRLVGLVAEAETWSIPTSKRMAVKPTDNILTLYMLPLAAALSSKILIGGCDGREPGEDYFWKHNSSVQYEGLMRTVFKSHPAFFRDRIYVDYYAEHCRQLEDQLSAWEDRGCTIHNVTHSYIPALVRRSGAPSVR